MSDTQLDSESGLTLTTRAACDIAAGRVEADPHAAARRLRAAHKDYNSRGSRRAHWFKMVLREGRWVYLTNDRLPRANFRAAERCATVFGDAFPGEVVICHDLGKGVDTGTGAASLVTADGLSDCDVTVTRSGLEIKLPDGSVVRAPNPRQP